MRDAVARPPPRSTLAPFIASAVYAVFFDAAFLRLIIDFSPLRRTIVAAAIRASMIFDAVLPLFFLH
jgi:hypothetical protein